MKTINRLSVAAAFLLSAALALSCSQMEEFEVNDPETPADEQQTETDAPAVDEGKLVPMSFSVTDTKTYVDGKEVKWEEGESIAVYDGYGIREFTMTSLENLTFEGDILENSTWQWAVYPYSAEGISATETSVTLSLDAVQTLGTKNVAQGMLLSAGKISGNGVVLKNLTSLVSVEVTKPDIASVVVEGAAVAGTATFSEDGSLTSVAEGSSLSATLKPASDVFTAGTYYVSVLPGLSESDVKVSVVRKDGYKGTKTVAALQLLRNNIYSAGQLDKTVAEWVYEVPDAAALLKWHGGHNGTWKTNMATNYADAHNKVLLTGDVDLGGVKNKWAYKNLYCEFDGNGHKIYNVVIERTANMHFFDELQADIHDVTFGSKDGTTYDGTSKIVSAFTGDETSWQYIGLFKNPGVSGVNIKNVVSYIPVTIPETATGRYRVGGLICLGTSSGGQDRTTTIEGCKTYGKISMLHPATSGVNYASGMVGLMDCQYGRTNTLIIKDCENHADIEVTQPSVEAIGGVLAERFANGAKDGQSRYLYMSITGCKNYGNIIHTNSTSGTRCSIGGVVGAVVESSAKDDSGNYYVKIENCENGKSGATSNTVTSNGKYYCLGGVAGWVNGIYMTGCKNYGTVSATDQVSHATSNVVGGISGLVARVYNDNTASNSDKLTVVNNCRNEGAVSAIMNTSNTGGGSGNAGAAVGGIVGSLRSIAEFKNNDNVGAVTGRNANNGSYVFVGGIAGHVHCSNDEDSFYNCRNAGTVIAGGVSDSVKSRLGVGGVIGKLQANIYSCANYGTVSSEYIGTVNNASAVVGMTRATAMVKDCIASGTVNGIAASSTNDVTDKTGATVTGTTVGGSRPSDL